MNRNIWMIKLSLFFFLIWAIFTPNGGELIGPMAQQDVHLFLADLEMIANFVDGIEKPTVVQNQQNKRESGDSRAGETSSLRELMEKENEEEEEKAGEGNGGEHLLHSLYYQTEHNANSRETTLDEAEEQGKGQGQRQGQCNLQVGLRDDYLAKYDQQMRMLMRGKLKREIGKLVKKLISRPNAEECPSDEAIQTVVVLSLYLLGYHFTVQLMDDHLISRRLISLFSPYFHLHEQLNRGGNALIEKLITKFGLTVQQTERDTLHKLSKHLYGGEEGQVVVEENPFLEAVEQKGWSFFQRIFQKKPQSIKYQTKGGRHPDDVLWATFNRSTGRVFRDFRELRQRFSIFKKNKKLVQQHNEENRRGMNSFEMEINHLADWTRAELRQTKHLPRETFDKHKNHLMGKIAEQKAIKRNRRSQIEQINTPEYADWRVRKVVGEVKDQGQCGSCWAFAATAALEGQIALKLGKLYDLSEQQCLDCSRKYGTDGCAGGVPEACYAYMLNEPSKGPNAYGIDQENDYPYQESDDKRCHYEAKSAVKDFKMLGWDFASRFPIDNREELLEKAVGNIGPIVAVINVTRKFDLYKDGVFYDEECDSDSASDMHAVTVVGYDKTPKGEKYWIVKNSWGKEWGKNGYVLMARNRDNNCQIADRTLYPIIDRVAPFDEWADFEEEEEEQKEEEDAEAEETDVD